MGQLLYADAIHIVEQSKVDAGRITTKSGNERRGSNNALAQFSASLGNRRRLEAAGSNINDIAGNAARLQTSMTTGIFKGRIAAAEEFGAVAAQAGSAGVGGASVEAYNETARLHNRIREQELERSVGEQQWAAGEQRGNTLKAAVAGIDNTNYRANLDYTQFIDHKKTSKFEQIVGLGLTAAATVFGGPQAGAAVMGIFEARQSERNGDFAGASSALSGVLQNGTGAARSYAATRDGPARQTTTQAPASYADPANAPASYTRPWGGGAFFNSQPNYGSITLK